MSGSSRPPLYPLSWGWNANGRAGNLTDIEIHIPSHVQHSKGNVFINATAGKHHSILISEYGNMFSVGENRKGQLGYGNRFKEEPAKEKTMQCYPMQVTPSGEIVFGKDLRISQVGAGCNFTVAREVSLEEGIDGVVGLRKLEESVSQLTSTFSGCENIHRAWAHIRHERFAVGRASQGGVLVWGHGSHGQLGLTEMNPDVKFPVPLRQLRNVNICSIAVGENHTLAITPEGVLYAWGMGAGGRLGHKDFEDRWLPERVTFFDAFHVEVVSAGVAHSALLVTNRKGLPRNKQLRRVVTFGRGAHGRLGNGRNKNFCYPVIVSQFPPSAHRLYYKQIVCGGAHTMVLGYKYNKKETLANPWRIVTLVYAWGFGYNGQLGTGYRDHHFLPIRVRLPRWEKICELSAGKSWSMARTLSGELYTWGKGLRGQLGQTKDIRFSLQPEKLQNVMSFLKLSSGYAHNMCIAVPRKYLNKKITEQAIDSNDVLGHEFVYTGLKQREAICKYKLHCCRRHMNLKLRSRVRFTCVTCDLDSICYNCAKQCHVNHKVILRNDHNGVNRSEDKIIVPFTAVRVKKRSSATIEQFFNKIPEYQCSATEKVTYQMLSLTKYMTDEELEQLKPAKPVKPKALNGPNHGHGKTPPPSRGKARGKRILLGATAPPHTVREHALWLPFMVAYGAKEMELFNLNRKKKREVDLINDAAIKKSQRSRKKKPPQLIEFVPAMMKEAPTLPVPYCECGMHFTNIGSTQSCHLLPTIVEVDEQSYLQRGERLPITYAQLCAKKIQRAARKYVDLRIYKMHQDEIEKTRKQVCKHFWQHDILNAVWDKVSNSIAAMNEIRENQLMVIEDDIRHKFDYYKNLQAGLAAMDAMMFGVRELVGFASIKLPAFPGKRPGPFAKATRFTNTAPFGGTTRNSTKGGSTRGGTGVRFAENPTLTSSSKNPSNSRINTATTTPPPPLSGGGFGALRSEKVSVKETRVLKAPGLSRSNTAKSWKGNLRMSGDSMEDDSNDEEDMKAASKPSTSRLSSKSNPTPSSSRARSAAQPPAFEVKPLREMRRSFAFSCTSIRELELRTPQKLQLHNDEIVPCAKYAMKLDLHEGEIYDPDVNLLTARFVKDAKTELWRARVEAREARVREARLAAQKEREVKAREKMMEKKNLIARAALIAHPPPPKGPPPKSVLLELKKKRKEEADRKKREMEEWFQSKRVAESLPFDQFDKTRPKPRIQKRNTMAASDFGFYERVKKVKPALILKGYSHRRNSCMSDILTRYYPTEKPNWKFISSIKDSLDMFSNRYQVLLEFIDVETYGETLWKNISAYQKKSRCKKVLGMGWCNPKFPPELLQRYGGIPLIEPIRKLIPADGEGEGFVYAPLEPDWNKKRERRYSVGEPERMYRQFIIMRSIRRGFQRLRGRLRRIEKMPLRRRSFDLNEYNEEHNGICTNLHLEYEEPYKLATTFNLKRDSETMNKILRKFKHWNVDHEDEEDAIAKELYLSKTYEIEDINWVSKQSRPGTSKSNVSESATAARYRAKESLFNNVVGEVTIWQEHFSDEGHIYYYCPATGDSSWEIPNDPNDQILQQFQDESNGNWYWYNSVTGESEWM